MRVSNNLLNRYTGYGEDLGLAQRIRELANGETPRDDRANNICEFTPQTQEEIKQFYLSVGQTC